MRGTGLPVPSADPADIDLAAVPADHPVVAALRGWCAAGHIAPRTPVIIACSGGADSLALAIAARRLRGEHPLAAVVVDHGLQDDSATVTARAAATLHRLGYDRVDTPRVHVGTAGGMEAAARDARYAYLRSCVETRPIARVSTHDLPAAVLLAHTRDDQAETVLLGLARGSGPRSIAGMRPWSPPWGRPLLTVRRADTEDLCRCAGVEYWSDPQNSDAAFTRVRLRREVIPLLDETLHGGVVDALARTAELMADDLAALDAIAQAALADARRSATELDCRPLADLPAAIRRRVIRAWLAAGVRATSLTADHLRRLDDLVTRGRRGSAVRIPGPFDVTRGADVLRCTRLTPVTDAS